MTYYNQSKVSNASVTARSSVGQKPLLELLISLPVALWQFLCALGTRRVVKGISLTGCIFAFFGIVGGIEAGLITFGLGAVLTVPLVIIEVLCLLPFKK